MSREVNKLLKCTLIPLIFIMAMWMVKIAEIYTHTDFSEFGVNPRTLKGLIGIVTSPFIHADIEHIIANTIPFFLTLSIIFYFYREIAYSVLLLVWLVCNLWVWAMGIPNTLHIGASGLVYGFVSFLLFSGFIRRNKNLMAISMLIVFLYGGFFWGFFPEFFPDRNISWESHLFGAIAGLMLAFYYRKEGMQREKYSWEDVEDDEDDDENDENDATYGEWKNTIDKSEKNNTGIL